MNYYYNETENSFAVTTNFKYNPIPTGFIEITEEELSDNSSEENSEQE